MGSAKYNQSRSDDKDDGSNADKHHERMHGCEILISRMPALSTMMGSVLSRDILWKHRSQQRAVSHAAVETKTMGGIISHKVFVVVRRQPFAAVPTRTDKL